MMTINQQKLSHSPSPSQGFTLIEIIIVVIIIGVIASLALSNYNKIIEQERCRTAQRNILLIKQALRIYFIRNKTFAIPASSNLNEIKSNLNLKIQDDPYFNYRLEGAGSSGHSARAFRNNGAYDCMTTDTSALTGGIDAWCSIDEQTCPLIK